MNQPFDNMPYLQQMNDQFRKIFGDDFVKSLMQSMSGMPLSGAGGFPFSGFGQTPSAGTEQPDARGFSGFEGFPAFGNQTGPAPGASTSHIPVDIVELRHELVLQIELPGLEHAADVRLSVAPSQVTIRGERRVKMPRGTDGKVVVSERSIGSFERTVPLPVRVRRQHAKAVYQQGILEVRLIKEARSDDIDASVIDIDFA